MINYMLELFFSRWEWKIMGSILGISIGLLIFYKYQLYGFKKVILIVTLIISALGCFILSTTFYCEKEVSPSQAEDIASNFNISKEFLKRSTKVETENGLTYSTLIPHVLKIKIDYDNTEYEINCNKAINVWIAKNHFDYLKLWYEKYRIGNNTEYKEVIIQDFDNALYRVNNEKTELLLIKGDKTYSIICYEDDNEKSLDLAKELFEQ